MSQKGFTFNANLCTGCSACQIACTIENNLPIGTSYRDVSTYNQTKIDSQPFFHLSMACNHCENPICMKQCPAMAINKDSVTGIVEIAEDKCIGCKFCSWVCPYDAPKFDLASGVMTKCDYCINRCVENLEPACTSICPTGALSSNFEKSVREEIPSFIKSSLKPAYSFIPRYNNFELPKDASPYPQELLEKFKKKSKTSKVEVLKEWPLILFTFLIALMGGLISSNLWSYSILPNSLILAMGILSTLFSTAHLGKKAKAYRAILNWKRSWLSREIIAHSGFMFLLALYTLLPGYKALGIGAFVFSFLTALCADILYTKTASVNGGKIHSSQITLTLLLFSVLVNHMIVPTVILLLVKYILYHNRKFKPGLSLKRHLLSSIRIGIGFILPVYFMLNFENNLLTPIMLIFIAELFDRIEFYDELEITTPQKEFDKLLIQ